MNLTQNHAKIAWQHWTAQFANSPRLEALVKALYAGVEDFPLLELLKDRWLDTAYGAQLDGIGQILGQPRQIADTVYVPFFGFYGQPNTRGFGEARIRREGEKVLSGYTTLLDREYRKILYWKIAVNTGHGTFPEINAAIQNIFDAQYVRMQNTGNASFSIWISKLPGPNDPLAHNARKWIPKAAGVGVTIITGSTENPFGFKEQGFYGFGVGTLAREI